MHFVRRTVGNEKTGAQATVYLPDPDEWDHGLNPTSLSTEIDISGEKREMLTLPLRMMLEFNATLGMREMLGHDCHVFALACRTGDDQGSISYRLEPDGSRVKIGPIELTGGAQEPETEAGDIVIIKDRSPDEGLEFDFANRHVMVRASVDNHERPLYVSKFGIASAVVVHDYIAAQQCYSAQSAGIVRDLAQAAII